MITASHRQRGATLLISLILLLIITVLAISSMREVTLEERIVGNLRDQQAAFNGAESALREGEVRLAASISSSPNISRLRWPDGALRSCDAVGQPTVP